jgi:hypothetical protein
VEEGVGKERGRGEKEEGKEKNKHDDDAVIPIRNHSRSFKHTKHNNKKCTRFG